MVWALSIVMLLGLAGCFNQEAAIAENKALANDIVVALELHAQTYGAYPDTLDELRELSGQMAIPVTKIDGDFFIGFDRRTERRLKRKLGV